MARIYGRTRILTGILLLLATIAAPLVLVNEYCFPPFEFPFPKVGSYPLLCAIYPLVGGTILIVSVVGLIIGSIGLLWWIAEQILKVCIVRGIREECFVKGDEAV